MRREAEGRSTEERREGGDRGGLSRRWSCCASCDARLAEDLPGMDRAGGGRWLRWKEIRATLINIEIPLMPKHGAPRGPDPWSTGKGHIAQ